MNASITTAATIAYSLTLWTITLTASLIRLTRPYIIKLFWAIVTAAIFLGVFFARFILPKLVLISYLIGVKILEIALQWIRRNPPVKINYFPEIVEDSPPPEIIPTSIEVIAPTPQLPPFGEDTLTIVTTQPRAKSTTTAVKTKGRGRPKKAAIA